MIELRVLGTIDLRAADGRELHTVLAQPKRLALLSYLAVATPHGFHRRDTLLALFWPEAEQERARAALRQSLHGLRQRLGDGMIANRGDNEVAVDRAALWSDAAAVDELLEADRITEAVHLYRGDLLPGFFLAEAPEFERWLDGERTRLRDRVARASLACAAAVKGGVGSVAVEMAQWARALAPDDESTTRQVIEVLNRAGDRAGALRIYDDFARRLAAEYDVAPSRETRALVEHIRAGAIERDVPVAPEQVQHSQRAPESGIRPQMLPSASAPPTLQLSDTAATLDSRGTPTVPLPRSTATALPRRAWGTTRTRAALVALFLTLAVAVGIAVQEWSLLSSEAEEPGFAASSAPRWILMADFESPPDDPTLGQAVRELASATLEQSGRVAMVPRDQLQSARRAAQLPDTALLTAERARHLAYRSDVSTVVEGRVDRIGAANYDIVMRAVDVSDGRVIASASAPATFETIIATVERLARQLDAGLGGRSGRSQSGPLIREEITPSFDAYRKYAGASDYNARGDYTRAVRLAREAVVLDPKFASAWFRLGTSYWNMGVDDSARIALEEARRHSDLLTPAVRLAVEAQIAVLDNDLATAVQLQDRSLQENPLNAWAFNARGNSLRALGRYDEAIDSYRRAISIGPAGLPFRLAIFNLARSEAARGNLDGARALNAQLDGAQQRVNAIDIAIAAGDWPRAEALATAVLSDPTMLTGRRRFAAMTIASAQAARGRVELAFQSLDAEILSAGSPHHPAELGHILLQLASNRKADRRGMRTRTNRAIDPVVRVTRSMADGDVESVQRELRSLEGREQPASSPTRHNVMLIKAWLAAQADNWSDVVSMLAPAAWRGEPAHPHGTLNVRRWLVAEAYERLDRPDSAAAFFGLLVSPTRTVWHEHSSTGLSFSFAHRRLAQLNTRLGRVGETQRHWHVFLQTFVDPDPEFLPMVVEAKQALQRLASSGSDGAR